MGWKLVPNPETIPAGTSVRATAGDNVLYGSWRSTPNSKVWGTIAFPITPSEPFVIFLKSWNIEVEVFTFWDVMADAEIGTTAQAKDDKGFSDAVYVKTEEGPVNARRLSRVGENSALAQAGAEDFNWTEPKSFFPEH